MYNLSIKGYLLKIKYNYHNIIMQSHFTIRHVILCFIFGSFIFVWNYFVRWTNFLSFLLYVTRKNSNYQH